jgi:YYY domain-containing protein
LLFLNTWDFPIYFSLLLGTLWWAGRHEAPVVILKRLAITAVGLTVVGVLFYLPWYPGFASQAGGILPNMVFSTRLPHFLVMFSTAFIPIVLWIVGRIRRGFTWAQLGWLAAIGVGIPLMLMLLSWSLGIVMAVVLNRQDPMTLSGILNFMGSDSIQGVFGGSLLRVLTRSWTSWILGVVIAAVGLVLMRVDNKSEAIQEGEDTPWPFVAILIGIGALLVLGPEYLYLKDQFGSRMNTIFKFYFAAWNLWGIAAAYATYALWSRTRRLHWGWAWVAVIPLLLGLFYPLMATVTKTAAFSPPNGRTLDGAEFISLRNPDDYFAMHFIRAKLDDGVLAEAVGGSYTYYGRMSAFTGIQTVLGWPGHESQWRGGSEEMGSRQADIDTLYRTRYWDEAKEILDRYAIDYVYVGALERIAYNPLYEPKFEAHMDLIFQSGEAKIYARRGEAPHEDE